ncbi:hypothetical protein FIV07_06495 [Mycobacterium sp. THAF192]|nr:hypothetical protein FIV07_06495 [Mycobacterium sp. THAF192]
MNATEVVSNGQSPELRTRGYNQRVVWHPAVADQHFMLGSIQTSCRRSKQKLDL